MTRFVVALYALNLAWGGAEEGGWWYETGSLARPLRICATEARPVALAARANRLLDGLQRSALPVSSAAYAGGRFAARVFERSAPEHYPAERPTYACARRPRRQGGSMPEFRITVSEALACPDGTRLDAAGRRLVLPDGRTLSPWITLEIDEERDLGVDELLALGIDPGLEIDRAIEPMDDGAVVRLVP